MRGHTRIISSNMRAANKKFIWAFGAFFTLLAFAPVSANAQTFGGSTSSSLLGGASTSTFQSPSGAQQSASLNAQGSGASVLLVNPTAKGLVVIGAPASEPSDDSYMLSSSSREIVMIAAVGALFAIGVLLLLTRQIKNSY